LQKSADFDEQLGLNCAFAPCALPTTALDQAAEKRFETVILSPSLSF
jgi:hypothetical protein